MLSEAAIKILEKRYLDRDKDGNIIETPEERFRKVAKEVASVEPNEALQKEYEKKFFEIMWNLDFLPNTPTLVNCGKNIPKQYKQYSACTVVDIEDNMESIGESVKEIMLLHKTGAGTGMNFSKLRPRGAFVSTTKGRSSGPIEFMKIHNAATETVKQGGVRRGANMGILEVWHPDIFEFINLKSKPGVMENFNLSVGVWDDFMQAVEADDYYELKFPGFPEFTRKVKAREIFDLIVHRAWESGEPGILFLSTINKNNPLPFLGPIRTTNPCGEQPLYPYEACNLGSINLANMVTSNGTWNWDKLEKTVEIAVRFLDNVVDLTQFPIEKFYKLVRGNRKIGLGVMGWADALIKLKIPYDSEEARKEAEKVMKFINEAALWASCILGFEKGNFPNFEKSTYPGQGYLCMRNALRTTIAPTGSIARIAGVNYGIEPLYEIETTSRILNGEEITVFHPLVKQLLDERGIQAKSAKDLPEDLRKIIRVAHEISPEDHVLMQAAFQKYTDNAVSKTVNLPHDATEKDVYNIFMLAWKTGCKGITVYRDGSRSNQPVISAAKNDKKPERERIEINSKYIVPRAVATDAPSRTIRVKTGCGKLFINLVFDEKTGEITEIFTTTNKNGGCKCNTEALAMAISALLRCNVDPNYVVKILRQGDYCTSFMKAKMKNPDMEGKSCPDLLGILINKYLKGKKVDLETQIESLDRASNLCPECNHKLEFDSGCVVCSNCGYSKCS